MTAAGELRAPVPLRDPPRVMPSPSRSLVALLAAAGLAASCAGDGGDADRVAERIDAQEEAQANLRGRIDELEQALAAATAPKDDAPTRAVEERLDELEPRVADLVRMLDELEVTTEDAAAETRAALSSLESAVSELRAQLEELSTGLTRLGEDQELLRRRFENHSH